jgi:UDP-N-acetylmuramoyl-tripeptide--D-alanyl-D-alanine ligase
MLPKDGVEILNADDPNVLAMRSRFQGKIVTYGLSPDAIVRAENIESTGPNRLSLTSSTRGGAIISGPSSTISTGRTAFLQQ